MIEELEQLKELADELDEHHVVLWKKKLVRSTIERLILY
jgi:hypothetical protein